MKLKLFLSLFLFSISAFAQTGLQTDDFTGSTLNSFWTVTKNANENVTVNGTDAVLSLTAGTSNDAFVGGNNSVRILQTNPSAGNFFVETKIDTKPTSSYAGGGIMVWQDTTHYLRFEVGSNNGALSVIVASVTSGTETNLFNSGTITISTSLWLRLQDVSGTFTAYSSLDGTNYTTIGTFTNSITASQVGLYAWNYNATPANSPAYAAQFDYFHLVNTNSLQSDNFSTDTNLQSFWQKQDLPSGGTVSVSGGNLTMSTPANSPHDGWITGNNGLLLLQNVNNADFTATATFTSVPPNTGGGEGLEATQDSGHWTRCDIDNFGSGPVLWAGYVVIGTGTVFDNGSTLSTSSTYYLKMSRTGTSWTCSVSTDGTNYNVSTTFTQSMNIAQIGISLDSGNNNAQTVTVTNFLAGTTSGGGNTPPPPTTGMRQRPRIVNNFVVADDGSQLHCVSSHIMDPLYSSYLAQASWWRNLRDFGHFNCVRAAAYLGYWSGTSSYMDGPTLQAHMDVAAANATATGMYLLLDNHSECCNGDNLTNDETFWTDMASRYANNTNVIYEVKNEPLQTSGNPTYQSYEQTMYSYVRNLAPSTMLIMWSTAAPTEITGLNTLLGSASINYTNAAVGLHPYNSPGDSQMEALYTSVHGSFPVMNTEYTNSSGAPGCCGFIQWLESNGYSWTWLDGDGIELTNGTVYGANNTDPITPFWSVDPDAYDNSGGTGGGTNGGGTGGTPSGQCSNGATAAPSSYTIPAGAIHTSSYGAVGNNTTDDTSHLQAAINAVAANGTLVFDTGTYKVSSNLNGSNNNGVTYMVATPGTVQINIPETNSQSIFYWGATPPNNTTIEGFILDGGGISWFNGSKLNPPSGWKITGNKIQNLFGTSGNNLQTVAIASDTGLQHSSIDHNVFSHAISGNTTRANCTINGTAETNYPECPVGGAIAFYGLDTTNISYNTFDHIMEGIKVCMENGYTTSGISIDHNHFTYIHRMAMEIQGPTGCGNTYSVNPHGYLTNTPITEDNVFDNPWDPYWNTFFASWALPVEYYNFSTNQTCSSTSGGCTQIGGFGVTVRNNLIYGVDSSNNEMSLAIELGSANASATGNYLVQVKMDAGIQLASALNGSVTGNYICNSLGSTGTPFHDEQDGPSANPNTAANAVKWNENFTPNTSSTTCPTSLASITLNTPNVTGSTLSASTSTSGVLTTTQYLQTDFYADGNTTSLETDTSSPFVLSASTTGLSNGSHTLKSTLTDLWCNPYTSSAQSFTITGSSQGPFNPNTFFGHMTITGKGVIY